jgi:hypothetical protein
LRVKTHSVSFTSTDLTSDTSSNLIWLGHIVNYSIQLAFTGAPKGTFKLQASVDEISEVNPKLSSVSNWTDIVGSDQIITEAGDHMWSAKNSGYTFVRVVWTADSTSNNAVLTSARFMVKGV